MEKSFIFKYFLKEKIMHSERLPWWQSDEESTCQCSRLRFDGWVEKKIPGGGNGKPIQHSCLENLMDRGARQAAVHGVANSLDTTEY